MWPHETLGKYCDASLVDGHTPHFVTGLVIWSSNALRNYFAGAQVKVVAEKFW